MRLSTIILLIALAFQAEAQPLPRSTPAAENVSSKNILEFLEAANKSRHEFHSVMILRHGKVVAEGWWSPYKPGLKHTMYSVSKSFTSTAVGFAVKENLLKVEDKVVSFFPQELPTNVNENLAALTVKDLLTMSVGQAPDPTRTIVPDSNWIRSFLATPVLHKPGTKFLYNSMATYMLSAIVQKVTGQKIVDYLGPRLFTPLGIEGMDWETDGNNINTGGWGLRIKTEDMAKLGQLYLQKGKWNETQVLPEAWVEEATSFKIDQAPDAPQSKKDSSDWMQGYCYQFWRSRNNSYRGDGAFGQFIIVLPEKDAVIAVTAETADMQDEFNLIWKYLYPAFRNEPVNESQPDQAALEKTLSSLALPNPYKSNFTSSKNLSGAFYLLETNEKNIRSLSFDLKGDILHMKINTDTSGHEFQFGPGSWSQGETTRPGPYLVAGARSALKGLPPFLTAGSYRWKDRNTLEMSLRYLESPHTETFTFQFKDPGVLITVHNSFEPTSKISTLKGVKSNKQ